MHQVRVEAVAKSSNPPRPRVIVVVAPKGGVGKTTVCMSLLVSARLNGLSVLGVNMDAQLSLDKWGRTRDEQIRLNPDAGIRPIPVLRLAPDRWREVAAMSGYDAVIVDTPPGHGESLHSIRSLCESADLVLIPTSATGLDLDEVIPFGSEVGKGRSAYVLNRVNRRTKAFSKARNALLEAGDCDLCPVEIPVLEAISGRYMYGLTTSDFGDAGAEALDGLWRYVRAKAAMPAVSAHG